MTDQSVSLVGKCVLVVEDDTFLRDLVSQKLQHEQVVLLQAGSGEEALEILKRAQKPEIILLDLVLPGISGFDTLAKIKADESLKDIPVIILSNLGQEKDLAEAKRLGSAGFMVKVNFSPSEIVTEIRRILG